MCRTYFTLRSAQSSQAFKKEVLKEAARYFRRLQSEVMATAKWEKMQEENPKLLLKVQKILLKKD